MVMICRFEKDADFGLEKRFSIGSVANCRVSSLISGLSCILKTSPFETSNIHDNRKHLTSEFNQYPR
jgi:hypothetical protein